MSARVKIRLPEGIVAKRIAGGRVGIKRWELHRGHVGEYGEGTWVGELGFGNMASEGWFFHPSDHNAIGPWLDRYFRSPEEALAAAEKAGLL